MTIKERKQYFVEYRRSDRGKETSKKSSNKYNATKKGRVKAREWAISVSGRASAFKYKASDKGKALKARYREKYPEKIKARSRVKRFPAQECSVKECALVGHKHHENYNDPLRVTYLCRQHHADRHAILKLRVEF